MSWRDALARISRRGRLHAAYRAVFGSPEGAMVLHDILRTCGMLEVSATPGDPYATHFNDGRRSIGLVIVERLAWREGELVKMNERAIAERLRETEEIA